MTLHEETLRRLDAFLKAEEALPIRDEAKIITSVGVGATARIQTIKDCILIVKGAEIND